MFSFFKQSLFLQNFWKSYIKEIYQLQRKDSSTLTIFYEWRSQLLRGGSKLQSHVSVFSLRTSHRSPLQITYTSLSTVPVIRTLKCKQTLVLKFSSGSKEKEKKIRNSKYPLFLITYTMFIITYQL